MRNNLKIIEKNIPNNLEISIIMRTLALLMRLSTLKHKRMTQVNVPATLIKMSKLPSVAQKMLLLDTIASHPIANYVCDGVAKIMDYHMTKKDSNLEMHNTINLFLVKLADRFEK